VAGCARAGIRRRARLGGAVREVGAGAGASRGGDGSWLGVGGREWGRGTRCEAQLVAGS
jgi:hypothetical protein